MRYGLSPHYPLNALVTRHTSQLSVRDLRMVYVKFWCVMFFILFFSGGCRHHFSEPLNYMCMHYKRPPIVPVRAIAGEDIITCWRTCGPPSFYAAHSILILWCMMILCFSNVSATIQWWPDAPHTLLYGRNTLLYMCCLIEKQHSDCIIYFYLFFTT